MNYLKRITLLLIICLSYSCSKDDINTHTEDNSSISNPNDIDYNYYKLYYADECYGDAVGSVCVSVLEYERAMQTKYYIDNVCFKIRVERSGESNGLYVFSYSVLGCN